MPSLSWLLKRDRPSPPLTPDEAAVDGVWRSDTFYVAAVESSIHAFITAGLDGIITSWSPGAERMLGYTAEEAVGCPIDLILPSGEGATIREYYEAIRKGERVETYEAVRLAKGGRKVHVVVTLSPIRSDGGEIVGVCSISSDITGQKTAERMFALIVETCPNGLIVTDSAGVVVMVNEATEALFGYGREELIGEPVEILVPQRMRSRHVVVRSEFGARAGNARTTFGRVMTGCSKDGEEIEFEIGLTPFMLEGRQMHLGVISDVRERRRVERMKDEFIATVSHELRTPLTSIIGTLGLLLGGVAGSLPPPAARLLSIAHTNGMRLVRLVNDMLDIEKIEAGKAVFEYRRTEIRALVEQAIESNRGFADQYGVHVVLARDAVRASVFADPDRITQVVVNLLANACKFSPKDGVVEVGVQRVGGAVRVSVRDHGPGVPEELRGRLFGKFAQATESGGQKREGSGLGLHIVKQIVDQHGGKVGFDDAPGGGTVFHFDLPADAGLGTKKATGPRSASRPHAMICSGDLDRSATLCAAVRSRGFQVDTVPTAAAALGHPALDHCGLFVIELPPRDMDGVDLVRRLRALPAHGATPVVVVASDGTTRDDDTRFDDLGVVGWLDSAADERLIPILERAKVGDGRPRILHVDHEEEMQDLVSGLMKREFDFVPARSLEEARGLLQYGRFDAALIETVLPDGRSSDLLPYLQGRDGRDIPVVVHAGGEVDERVLQRAAAVLKKSPVSVLELLAVLRRVLETGSVDDTSQEKGAA